jgi:LmbE family N-acetylglucosaminyl deacetylase
LPTLDESWERALCVVAHPDDLEYGAAAAVARWTQQGKSVTYLLATRGEAGIDGISPAEAGPLREQEQRDSASVVGVEEVAFLAHRDGMVEYGLPLRRDLARAIRSHQPDVLVGLTHRDRFAGGGTNQADHRAVGLALVDAAKDAGNRWIFPELVDEGYEPWGGTRWVAFFGAPDPTHAVDVTGHLPAAIASLEAHAAYLAGLGPGFPPPDEFLEMIMAGGGVRQGVEHALLCEVFEL